MEGLYRSSARLARSKGKKKERDLRKKKGKVGNKLRNFPSLLLLREGARKGGRKKKIEKKEGGAGTLL